MKEVLDSGVEVSFLLNYRLRIAPFAHKLLPPSPEAPKHHLQMIIIHAIDRLRPRLC
ncbi:MAG: hypothetical protein SNJ78_05795 [Spirochaetales bacterium]